MFVQTALTSIDSYKLSHAVQYPVGTTKVYSNFTPRSNTYFGGRDILGNKIVWFGLQGFLMELKRIWDDTFFTQDIDTVATEYVEFVAPFCGPNGFDSSRIRELHQLGYLPLEIKALPEGSLVNIGVPVLTITNTLPRFYWLPNFLETWLSSDLWKSSTSASTSAAYRKILEKYYALTGANTDFIAWAGHDFSVRGMSGIVDAAKSGAGHLLSFTGTDNIPAVKYMIDCYDGAKTFIGGSVPATEHSVMCAGSKEGEIETFRRLIKTCPSGVVSIVSDTWDFWNVVTVMATELKEEILARVPDQFGLAKVVFRPDSGDPVKIICGDSSATPGSPEYKGAIECLAEVFGTTVNAAGYKTLNPRVGLIYGDSITLERADAILRQLADKGYAADNIVFGIGSFTFQYTTRDSLGFAMKATYVEIANEGRAIFKDPKTDNGTKRSARGLLRVRQVDGNFVLDNDVTLAEEASPENCLQTVFLNGKLTKFESLQDIRYRLNAQR
jgi:nicotinamide phosphoribosyltransferase